MGSFFEKINERKKLDSRALDRSSKKVYSQLGKIGGTDADTDDGDPVVSELKKICRFWNIPAPEKKGGFDGAEEAIRFFSDETGIMTRRVVLTGSWWKNGAAPLLCEDGNGAPRALIPDKSGGYVYYENGRAVKLNGKNAAAFDRECRCFYRPMKNGALTVGGFIKFLCGAVDVSDIVWLLIVSLAAGLAGLIMPAINGFIFNSVIPSGTPDAIPGISVLIAGTVLVQAFCAAAKSRWVTRIGNKTELLAQNALWARILALPVGFFKEHSSGELAERAESVNTICEILSGQLIPVLLGAVFSFTYMFQISWIATELFAPSAAVIAVVLILNAVSAALNVSRSEHNDKTEIKLSGMIFQFLNGLTKIKLCGAEARAFGKWAELYSKLKIMTPKMFIVLKAAVNAVIFGGMILIYYMAYRADMSASQFIAFNTAFSAFTAAVIALGGVTDQAALLKPAFDMIKPILEAEPETAGYKKQVEALGGDINVDKVRFRYNDSMPYVLDGLELHIKKGEYIGITGSSGCGKSTLIRILLGFERPQSGSVYYDMHDLDGLDVRSVRRRIGVVLQDGKLFSGDIYSNIVICAPWLSVEQAWEAAEKAGLAEDIRQMPMGMFTMISEGGGGLSGGQQQRLLIARALAADPDVIMFDEATSALDNITQATVVKTLEEMSCTRIVIAHRLSTVKNCSRIIYLDKGRVTEEGTYEELMSLGGKFAEMAERQLV